MNLAATMSLDAARFLQPLNAAKSALGGFTGAISTLGNIGNIFTGIQSAVNLARGALGPFAEAINAAAAQETLATTFRVLLGSAEAAKQAMQEAQEFADLTPFDPEPVQQAYKALLAYGFALKDIKSILTDAGDLASGMNVPLNEVTRVLGRLRSGDFGEAFERLRDFGISRSDLEAQGLEFDKGGSFQGTAEQALNAVLQIIRQKFGGVMEEVSKTWDGRMSTFVGYVRNLFKQFGEPIKDALKAPLEAAISIAQQLAPLARQIGESLAPLLAGAAERMAGIAKGLIAAIQGGRIGDILALAFQGAAKILLSSIAIAINGVIDVLKAGLRGAFQSAVDLLSQRSLWEGIGNSVMSIVYQVRSALMEMAADLVDKLPTAMRFGADTKRMREIADADSLSSTGHSMAATSSFAKVEMSKAPLIQAGMEAFAAVQNTLSSIMSAAGNIPEFQQLRDQITSLAETFDIAAQSVQATAESVRAERSGQTQASLSNELPKGSAYDIGDSLAKVGGFIGGGSAVGNKIDRTNSLMQMSVDLLRSGVELWKNMQKGGTAWA